MSDSEDTINILHVDDEPSFTDLAATYLENEDDRINVHTVTSPNEGLAVLDEQHIDCIVSDYDMPRTDGIEFLESIREAYPDLPFILYTGKGSEEVAADAISAGVSDYLQKERGTDQYTVLANRIINLVDQHRAETKVEEYAQTQATSEEYRQRLTEILSDPSLSDETKFNRLLELGCERFDVENGHLVMIDESTDRHNVINKQGSDIVKKGVSDLSNTYCRKTIESEEVLHINHASEQGWKDDPAYEAFGLECYIGGKLTVDDELFGTLCFVDTEPREPFTHNEKAFFDLLVRWSSQILERRQRLNQANTIFEHTQDALFLINVHTDETFTVQAVNRAYEELTGLSTADLHGQTPRELLGDDQGAEVEARYQECVDKQEPIEYDEELSLDGDTKYWHTRLAPVIKNGRVIQLVGATRDITDRKEREQELRVIEQRLEAILENTTTAMFMKDRDGEYIFVNQQYRDIFDLHDDEIIGRTDYDIHPSEMAREVRENDQAVIESGDSLKTEEQIVVDGNERIFLSTKVPIYDTGEESDPDDPVAVFGIATDITERKAYERQLREERQFVHSIFQSLPDPLYAFDTDGYPIRWNDQLEDVTGYTGDEIEEMHATEFVPEEEAETIAENFRTILDEKRSVAVESAFETKAGDRIPYEFTGGPLEAADGTIRGVTGIGRDITGWKDHERRLQALHRATRELLAAETRQEIAELGVEVARDIVNLEANAIHLYDEETSGLVPVAATDPVYDLIGEPPVLTDGESIAWRVYQQGEPLSLADVNEDQDLYNPDTPVQSELFLPIGTYGILIATSEEYEDFDGYEVTLGEILTANIAIALSNVERRDQLQTRERELIHQNERLEEFVSVVSHDLRNPLNVADGRLELARKECESEHLDAIEQALNRMDTLIEDLLTLARENTSVAETEPVDLASVIEGCWATVQTADATLVSDTSQTIEADKSRLKQVFENLFRNAVEHGGKDVTITIGELDDGFYIEDDGPGIPEGERDDVFDAGYSTREAGTGFGLRIVKQIVDAHGWEISLTDGTDGGARFEVTIS